MFPHFVDDNLPILECVSPVSVVKFLVEELSGSIRIQCDQLPAKRHQFCSRSGHILISVRESRMVALSCHWW